MQLNLVSPKDGQAIFADYTRYMEYSCHEIHGIQWSRGIWNAVVTRFMEYSVTKNRDRFLNSLFFEAWMSTSSAVQGYSVFLGFFHGQVYVEGIWHMLMKSRLKAQWKSENES